jgi:hypothetical protein
VSESRSRKHELRQGHIETLEKEEEKKRSVVAEEVLISG